MKQTIPVSDLKGEGVALKNCDYIYAPAGQAGEYAPLATNPYRGCGHGCAYCYVPSVIRMERKDFDAGANVRPDYLKHLERDARRMKDAGHTFAKFGYMAQVMFSFTTDPYHPGDTDTTRKAIELLRAYDFGFCTLTKGGSRALRDLDLFRPDRDAFASTLTSLDDHFSSKWERNAQLPGDRIATLRKFHDAGIFTWVSLEPTLDIDSSIQIVIQTHQFVDLFKIGRVNYLPMTKTTNWEDYTKRIIDVCQKLGVKHYVKQDLQRYLPKGYHNPRRIQQHH